ncbi:MAG TPA: histidine kinase dimerization/phospho-acceptor domain-containing protein, partial [Pontiella sp.]
MSPLEVTFAIAYCTNIALGIGVFLTNHKRTVNQVYLTLSAIIAAWLTSNWLILRTEVVSEAIRLVQLATALAIYIPVSCHLLRLSILNPSDSWIGVIYRARKLLIPCIAVTIICFSPYLITDVRLPTDHHEFVTVAEPVYSWGFLLFALLFVGLVASLVVLFIGDRKRTAGLKRIELEFITIGYSFALVMGTLFGLLITVVTGSSQTVPMANMASILILTLIISYGIATKKILGIASLLRKFLGYLLLTSYLVFIYLIIHKSISLLVGKDALLPEILGALAVAFSMAPVHGTLQKISKKLIATKTMDVAAAMERAGDIFQTVGTDIALLNHFSELLLDALEPEFIKIALLQGESFRISFPADEQGFEILRKDAAVAQIIEQSHEPLGMDALVRVRQTVVAQQAFDEMKSLDANIIVGFYSKYKLCGIVILGPRTNGQIYDKAEQDALRLLCNQFGVALENARLYTEMQNSKIRNEIMLEQLVSGVIVANTDRTILLFNGEAQRITGLAKAEGHDIVTLPKPLADALEATLTNNTGVRNIEATLLDDNEDAGSKHIRFGTSFLIGHDDQPMGALLVFTDTTELKSLEEQVRRSDQLSSVGTLAAGMAHEIKNPLVTIKTFTQLLPQRYGDEDFRQNFSSLVAHEVARIDGIVNELLSFSKPAKPHLVPMTVQDTIEQTIK